jgi:hypothetical protein
MVFFSQLPSVKKDNIFGAARKLINPSYFVMALPPSPSTSYYFFDLNFAD